MAAITFQFNQKKAIEAILYLAPRVSESDVYGICKLLYIVDKVSLEKYGRFIFGESYSALPEGATPSHAYDLLCRARHTPIDGIKVQGDEQVISLREPDLDYLSKSDIECLDQIINSFGKASYKVRAAEAHDAAYYQAWNKRGRKQGVDMPVESIAELFANADDLIDYLSNRNAN
jgi:antitoxin SocA-like protein